MQAAALLARTLRQSAPGEVERAGRDVENILGDIERMAVRLTDLAHMASVIETRGRTGLAPVSVGASCHEALLAVAPVAEDRGVAIAADIRDAMLAADPRLLAAAVEGLLLAALRHDRGNGVGLAVTVRRAAARIEVTWRGGLPKGRQLTSVFVEEACRRSDRRPVLGAGLGLVAEIARIMRWRVTATAGPDGLCRLTLACPAAPRRGVSGS